VPGALMDLVGGDYKNIEFWDHFFFGRPLRTLYSPSGFFD
jgi:hypothetical protein